MRHVRQVNDHDCGIAVAAMLSRRSYRTIVSATAGFPPHRGQGVYVSEMVEVLARLTRRPWMPVEVAERVCLSDLPRLRCAVVIGQRAGVAFGHWVALDGCRTVYDPEMHAPLSMPEYPFRDWRVLRAVVPR